MNAGDVCWAVTSIRVNFVPLLSMKLMSYGSGKSKFKYAIHFYSMFNLQGSKFKNNFNILCTNTS